MSSSDLGTSGGDASSCLPDMGLVSGIGYQCLNPLGSQVHSAQISNPALECAERLCLLEPLDAGAARATCTATCTADCDCAPATTSQCAAGFVCAAVASAGA